MGTGCIIYTIVAYTVGWIGGTSSIIHGIIAAIFQIALAFIIWGGFMLHYRNDVRKMNEKIKELWTCSWNLNSKEERAHCPSLFSINCL